MSVDTTSTRCAQDRGAYVDSFCCCSDLNFLLLSSCFTWMVFSFMWDLLRMAFYSSRYAFEDRRICLYWSVFSIPKSKAQSTHSLFAFKKWNFHINWLLNTKHRELWNDEKSHGSKWIPKVELCSFKMIHENLMVEIGNKVANIGNCKQQVVTSDRISYFNG